MANASALVVGSSLVESTIIGVSRVAGCSAEGLHQGQAVDVGHDEVLEDHRRADLAGDLDGAGGVLAVVERDVGLAREHPPDRLADHGLVVDQQDRDLVLGQLRLGIDQVEVPWSAQLLRLGKPIRNIREDGRGDPGLTGRTWAAAPISAAARGMP